MSAAKFNAREVPTEPELIFIVEPVDVKVRPVEVRFNGVPDVVPTVMVLFVILTDRVVLPEI